MDATFVGKGRTPYRQRVHQGQDSLPLMRLAGVFNQLFVLNTGVAQLELYWELKSKRLALPQRSP